MVESVVSGAGLTADVAVRRSDDFCVEMRLSIPPGKTVALLGPNGAGKSTVVTALAGLMPVTSGRISLNGAVLDEPAAGVFVPAEDRRIGVVFQDYLLFPHLSVLENVSFGLRSRRVPHDEGAARSRRWLARLGLAELERRKPADLSGGQAQRVALARALVIDPDLLLLDEPLAALDVATRRQVRRDLRHQLSGFGGVRVLVTHDPVDAYALADRVAIVDGGSIVQTGTVAEITAHPRSRYVAELVGTNLIEGHLDGSVLVAKGGVEVAVVADFDGPAFAIVRPQSITLARVAAATSARNTFRGIVDDVDRIGDRVRVGVAGPLHLTAEITVAALDGLGLRPGDEVTASLKATDIETYPA
jgi:molybdate transport system ATP-binding protein